MDDAIRLLAQLHRIDLEVLAIEAEEKGLRERLSELSSKAAPVEDEVKRLSAEAAEFEARVKAADDRIRQSLEQIAKDEKRLSAVKNDKELKAVNKEVASANKARRQAEEEKANISSKAEAKKAVLREKEAAIDSINKEVEAINSALGEKHQGWKETLEAKLNLRESIKAGISPALLKQYENIRAKRGGIGLALVKDEVCQACFINIQPQVYILLRKGTGELFNCPHCNRILYVETASASPQVEAAVNEPATEK